MRVVRLLFFLSGVAGLIYQVVWSRLLAEVFGVTVYAVTTVLATFLGGLALGSWLLGRVADRRPDPLRFYGWLEIGIGVTALVGTWTIRALDPVHVWAANRLATGGAALVLVRALLASLVILPPTVLMGGTLPAVTRVFVERIQRLGRELSLLYALNTLGAVVGALGAGFVLIRWLGLHPTLWIAVGINVAVGAASLVLAARLGTIGATATGAGTGEASTGGSRQAGGLLIVFALSGFASLGLEVLWTRALVLAVGTSTYAFVTMLASFLVGITAGSLVTRLVVDRVSDARRAFGWVELGIALATLATLPLLRRVTDGTAERWLAALGGDWLAVIGARFAVTFLVMLAPTTLIGMTFPLAGKLWAVNERSLGGRLGQVYGANTLGNILGAFLTGFVLLPAVGIQKGIATLAMLNVIAAAWGFARLGAGRRAHASWVAPLLVSGALGIVALWRWQPPPFEAESRPEAQRLVFYDEGVSAVVSVYQDRYDPRQRWMMVDGVRIGTSYRGIDEKQQALAHFPFLLMPEAPPRRILSIGLGTGILLGEAARHPSVEAADCVEISSSVIEGARRFDGFNGRVLDDPRVRVFNDDGVNFLRRRSDRYDAIMSDEKSRTGHAGNAVFFSADYYELCRDHLAPGGVMIQWVPLDVPPGDLPVILRSFIRAFPYSYVWVAPPLSCFLVGTTEPLVLDAPHIERELAAPATADLRRYGWRDAYGFMSLLMGDRETLEPWLARGDTINTLEHPVLEFYSPRAYAEAPNLRMADNLHALADARDDRPRRNVKFVGVDASTLEAHDRAAVDLLEASARLQRGDPAGVTLMAEALAAAPAHGPVRYAAARAYFESGSAVQARGDLERAIALYRRAAELDPELVEALGNLGGALLGRGATDQAAAEYRQALAVNPDDARVHFGLGVALAVGRRFGEAIEQFNQALRINPEYAEARAGLAKAATMQAQDRN